MIISIPQGLKTAFSSTVGKQTAAKVSSQTLVVLHRPLETKSQCAFYPKERWPSAITGLCIGIMYITPSRVLKLEFTAFS